MIGHIARLDAGPEEPPILFVLDTGDIVQDGRHAEQFHQVRDLLAPIRQLPYLLAVGNHELAGERDPRGRQQTEIFLRDSVRPNFPGASGELHWEWSHGPLRILALDSNRIVYRQKGESSRQHRARATAELEWLRERLGEPEGARHTILALHHPFVQSSAKHRESAIELWGMEHGGTRLLDLLADAGVDLILTGHTHTYELFRLTREDGRGLWQMNLSGRPRGAWLGLGAWERRATDIRGQETVWLDRKGFDALPGWSVEQTEVMLPPERNQYAVFSVAPSGEVSVRVQFFEKKPPYALVPSRRRELLPPPSHP
jgi:hypothetical protein